MNESHAGGAGRARAALPGTLLVALVAVSVGAALLALSGAPSGPPPGATSGTVIVAGDTVPAPGPIGPTTFVHPGPFAAGEATLALPGGGAPVEVWYPATPASVKGRPPATYDIGDWLPAALKARLPKGFSLSYPTGAYRGVPVAPGRFPLVVFCHGFSGFRDQSTFLTSRLATWGFVVAAPDFLDHDLTAVLSGHLVASTAADVAQVESTISLMVSAGSSPQGAFSGHVDRTKVAVIGHSLGGEVAEQVAAVDPVVKTFVGMAGASVGALGARSAAPSGQVPDKPGMLMVGTADHVVSSASIVRAYHDMVAPKRLVMLQGAGHLAFSDICELAPGQGGLLGVAKEVHITVPAALVPLASDGCQAGDLSMAVAWSVIRQAVTAQLRSALGFDPPGAGLSGLRQVFGTALALNEATGPTP